MAEIDDGGLVDDLEFSRFLDMVQRRRGVFLGVWAACFLLSAAYVMQARPVYRAQTLIEIEKPEGAAVGQPLIATPDIDDEYFRTQYRLIKSDTLTQSVYDALDLVDIPDFAPPRGLEKLQKVITVQPESRNRLAYLQVDCHDADLAVRISTALAAAYVEWNAANSMFMTKEVLQSLQLNRGGMDAQRVYESLPAVVDNKVIQSIKDQKISVEAQVADLTQKYTENHPLVMAANSRLSSLDRILQAETDKIIASLKTQLSGKLVGNNVRVIDWARRPDEAMSPKKARALALGLLGGLCAGLVCVFLVELLDQSVRSVDDVELKLGQPLLGLVPAMARKRGRAVYESLLAKESSFGCESFRNLRTMVDYAAAGVSASPLLVTSALKEEGKSYVATNLAVAFALAGEKVLLIDGDLRRPSVHRNLALSVERGLSDFLAGKLKAEDLAGLVQNPGVAGLEVLVCGLRPPNPSELLNTPRLSALVTWASAHYGRVVVDCPPMFPINDTLLWGRYVRAAVVVARFGKTRAPLVRQAFDRLQGGGIRPLGAVVNFARLARMGYGYYEEYYAAYEEAEAARSAPRAS